jgi:uncharacterized membrane protein
MSALRVLAVACYPFLIYVGLRVAEPRTLSVIVGVVLLLRGAWWAARGSPAAPGSLAWPALAALPVLLLGVLYNQERALLLVPSLINAALLVAFGWTLWQGPSMVEVLARAQGGAPAEAVSYCRAVTGIWCAFFALNGGIALGLALYASVAHWALYTGFVSYLLIALLFGGEVVYRHRRFRGHPSLRRGHALRGEP